MSRRLKALVGGSEDLSPAGTSSPFLSPGAIVGVVLVGLAVRLAILAQTGALQPQIIDEQQYLQIARNLAAGHGFGWGPGDLTSIRPPLYPSLLAVAWSAWGPASLQAVRLLQIGLSLGTAALVYTLGMRLWSPRAGAVAAVATWLYPSLIFANFLILTETLFTFLLVLFLFVTVRFVQRPSTVLAFGCGVTLGLAALTRSVLWPLPLLLCPMLMLLLSGSLARRAGLVALMLAGYAVIVTPWAVRNTRLQGVVTIVDTMGGMNLRMGNYEYTPDDRMWDAVGLTGQKNWVHGIEADFPGQRITEGQKEKWAQRKAIDYMVAHPTQTLRRSAIKFADFWGLEREFMAGVRAGFFDVPFWFAALVSAAIVLAYAAVALSGAAGVWLGMPNDWRAHVILLLPVLLIMGVHTIVFGHSRYHVPLVPILAMYGAALVSAPRGSFQKHRLGITGATVTIVVFVVIWIRQIAFVDLPRITSWLGL